MPYFRKLALLVPCFMLFVTAEASDATHEYSPLNAMSFEGGIPGGVRASKGDISITEERWAAGRKGLRWDFVPGDTLTIQGPMGFVPEPEERDGNAERRRPIGFHFPVFADRAYGIDMEIAFGRGDQVDCWTDVRLIRAGWEHFKLLYARGHLTGAARPDMDFCRFTIKGDVSGTLYLDNLFFAKEMRGAHDFPPRPALPSVRAHPSRRLLAGAERSDHHLSRPWYPLSDAVTTEEAESLRTLELRYLEVEAGGDVSVERHGRDRLDEVRSKAVELGIVADGDRINGPVIADAQPYAQQINTIGILYRQTQDVEEANELGELGRQIAVHAIQADLDIGWYNGRGMADGMYLIRDVLAKHGLLATASEYLREQYEVNRIYDLHRTDGYHNIKGADSDYLYTNSIGSLLSLLMMPDSPEKVRDLRHYVDWYSEIATGYAPGLLESLKPDGSHFHHMNANLHGYGYYTPHVISKMFRWFSNTAFRLSQEAHERFRNNLRVRAFYRTNRHFPMAYSQLVYPTTRTALPDEFMHMALAGSPDGREPIDREMAGEYLRLVNRDDLRAEDRTAIRRFKEAGVTPAAVPQGHHTLSYFAKAIHRRDDWMAVVGGHSRYVYKMELWPATEASPGARGGTAFTQFVNTGTLEIIRPDLPGRNMVNNGFEHDGWDWTHFPGTTAIAAPLDRIRARVVPIGDDTVEHLFSDQPFVGGLKTPDGQGIFTGTFRGHDKYDLQSMYATKSWFFFNDLIVCLGSGIRNQLGEYETHTTLFQNGLGGENEPIFLRGVEPVTQTPNRANQVLEQPAFLVDNRGVGYFLPSGQELGITRGIQRSRSSQGNRDTEGLFAKAWLAHGRAPTDGGYEYAVKANTTAEAMAGFAEAMAGDEPPYEVLRADQDAHILRHRATNHVAAVMFHKNFEIDLGVLSGVSHSALIMIRPQSNDGRSGIELCVSDPDLRFYEGPAFDVQHDYSRVEAEAYSPWWLVNDSIPSTIHVVLNGYWDIQQPGDGDVRVIQHANDKTVVAVRCQHGLTQSMGLIERIPTETSAPK